MSKNKFSKFIESMANKQMTISITALALIIALNLYEIIIRAFLDKSIIWIQEVSVLFMVWMIFCGFTKIVYENKNINIELLVDNLPKKVKNITNLFTKIIIVVFLVIFSYYGFFLLSEQIGIGTYTSNIPKTLYTFPVILNSVSVLLIYINNIYNDIILLRNGGENEWK